MALGERIKMVRKYYKYNQRNFSNLLGLSQAHISNIECNKDHPSDKLLKTICSVCNVSYNWLKYGEGEMTDNSPSIQNALSETIKKINSNINPEDKTIKNLSLINSINELIDVYFNLGRNHEIQAVSQFYSSLSKIFSYYKDNYDYLYDITPENVQKEFEIKNEFVSQIDAALDLLVKVLFLN